MYIVIECWPDAESAAIVMTEDGMNKVFTTYDEANAEAGECQNGKVVAI